MAKNIAIKNRLRRIKYCLTRLCPMTFCAVSFRRYAIEYPTVAHPTIEMMSMTRAPKASTEKKTCGEYSPCAATRRATRMDSTSAIATANNEAHSTTIRRFTKRQTRTAINKEEKMSTSSIDYPLRLCIEVMFSDQKCLYSIEINTWAIISQIKILKRMPS